MAYSLSSFPTDYDQQSRWQDVTFQQYHNPHTYPRYCPNGTPDSHFDAANNKAWHKSTGSVANDTVWSSRQYNAVSSPGESVYTEDDIQRSSYVDDVEHQHGRYMYDSSPDISGHQGDMVASPIDETHRYYTYPVVDNRSYVQRSSFPHEWAQEARMSPQGRVGVPDEYRASIARHSDKVHASGLHGLEGDNDAVHVRRCGKLHKVEKAEPVIKRAEPTRFHPRDWNMKVASDAFNSLIPLDSLNDNPLSSAMYAGTSPFPESPVTVPSQQHIADYSHHQQRLSRSQSPDAFSPHFQSALAPLMNHLPPPPTETSAFGGASPQLYLPLPSSSPSPRQGLEHQSPPRTGSGSGSASPSRQEDTDTATYPGSSQTVLKMSTPKKVVEKKQALACLFCRERKIACGRPDPESDDQTCNQCARRHIECEYPKESRRGQHKRTRRKATHDHDVNQSSPRSSS